MGFGSNPLRGVVGRRKSAARTDAVLIGGKQLDAALKQLGYRGSKNAIKAGVRAGLTVAAKAFRQEINGTTVDTPHAASLKAGVRKTVGKRLWLDKATGTYQAKVGFAVNTKGGKRNRRTSRGQTTGVGISPNDVHWFTLTGAKRPRSTMEPQFNGVAKRAAARSAAPALAKAKEKIRQRIAVEARKARTRGG